MSQLGSIYSYVGRTVDLLAFQGVTAAGEAKLSQSLVQNNEGGELCTGIQKLVQRWLLEFMTITGSLTYLPNRGCPFIQQLRQGQLRTTIDAIQAFYLSALQIKLNLQGDETATTPADEAYASVTLNSVTVAADSLAISVTIASQAGQSALLILPVAVVV